VFFDYSAEQQDFRDSLRKLVADRAPLPAVRERLGDAHDPDLWRTVCDEMALLTLAVPERYGGAGFSLEETAVAVAELGRGLAPVPLFEAVLAIEAILRTGTEAQCEELLPGLLSGERIAVAAVSGADGLDSGSAPVTATPAAGQAGPPIGATPAAGRAGPATQATRASAAGATAPGHTLTGSLRHVLRAHVADLLIVPAAGPDGPGLFAAETAAPGVTVSATGASFDLTRPVCAVDLDAVPAVRLGDGSEADVEGLLDVGRTLLAAEMTAAAEACLDAAVEYAKRRVQFNRAIGSFQAVKHGCAQLAVELDAARAAADWAAMLAAAGDPGLRTAALIAKVQAADTFTACAGWNIQVHGGIGFTWEHDAHLYLRRAKADEALFGSSARHRALLADRAGL
jgi:alkylation response protein AidB-like acyl-CoA dehydrogenase